MSESNRVGISYVKENSDGTLPSNPVFQNIPYVSMPGLGGAISSIVSQTITTDRQVTDVIPTGEEVSGDLNLELKPENYDDLISLAFFNEWVYKYELKKNSTTGISNITLTNSNADSLFTLANNVSNNYQVGDIVEIFNDAKRSYWDVKAVSANSITLSGKPLSTYANALSDFSFRLIGLKKADSAVVVNKTLKTVTINAVGASFDKDILIGSWICVAKSLAQANTQPFFVRVIKVTKGSNLVINYDNSFELTGLDAEKISRESVASAKTAVYFGSTLINGVEKQTISLLQRFESHNPVSQYRMLGLLAGNMNLNFEVNSVAQLAITFLGRRVITDVATRTIKEPVILNSFSTGASISAVMLGDDLVSAPNIVQTGTITLNNNPRQQNGIGYVGAVDIAVGTCDISGSLSTFFGDDSLYQQLVKNEESSFMTFFLDGNDKKAMVFDIPRIKFTSGAPEVPGINTDVTYSPGYQGLKHKAFGFQILCQSFPFI